MRETAQASSGPLTDGYWAQVQRLRLRRYKDLNERYVLCRHEPSGQFFPVRRPDDLSQAQRAEALKELAAKVDPFGTLQ